MLINIRQQKESTHSMARRGHMKLHKWLSLMFSVLLLIIGLYTKQPAYFILIIMSLLIAFSAHQTGPHIHAASETIRSGTQRGGAVKVKIGSSSDSDKHFATVTCESLARRGLRSSLWWASRRPNATPMRLSNDCSPHGVKHS